MPRLTAEEKHQRQLAKLQKQNAEPEVQIVRQPNPKAEGLEAAQRAGFECELNSDILLFYPKDSEEETKIRKWVSENYNYSWGLPGRRRTNAAGSALIQSGTSASA